MPVDDSGPWYLTTATTGITPNTNALQEFMESTRNTSTTVNFGTNTTVRWIRVVPFNPSTATVEYSGSTNGWGFSRADFNATSNLPAHRLLHNGSGTARVVLVGSTADTSSVFAVRVFFHKIRTDNSVLSGNQFGIGTSALAPMGITERSFDVTVESVSGLPTTFQNNESIAVEVWVQGRGGGTTGAVNQTITVVVGPPSLNTVQGSVVAFDLRGIRYQYPRNLIAGLVGVAQVMRKRIMLPMIVTATGVAAMGRVATMHKSLSATMIPVAESMKTIFKDLPSAILAGTTVRRTIILTAKEATMSGAADFDRFIRLGPMVAPFVGVTNLKIFSVLARRISATMVGVAGMSRAIIAVRRYAAIMTTNTATTVNFGIHILSRFKKKIIMVVDD